jgi:hypothetical protein
MLAPIIVRARDGTGAGDGKGQRCKPAALRMLDGLKADVP